MQPHLPHKLAAWVLAASVFGAMASQSQAAGESISINFGSNEGTIPDSSTAGLSSVTGSNWNQFSDASQSTRQALKDNNGAATGADVTWSSKNIWQTNAAPTTGDGQLLKGYLDDGNGINITVSGLDFLTYKDNLSNILICSILAMTRKKAEGELSNESVDLCTAEQREG